MRLTRKELTNMVISMGERIRLIERGNYNLLIKLQLIEINYMLSKYGFKLIRGLNLFEVYDYEGIKINECSDLSDFYEWFNGYKKGIEDGIIMEDVLSITPQEFYCNKKGKTKKSK